MLLQIIKAGERIVHLVLYYPPGGTGHKVFSLVASDLVRARSKYLWLCAVGICSTIVSED